MVFAMSVSKPIEKVGSVNGPPWLSVVVAVVEGGAHAPTVDGEVCNGLAVVKSVLP